MAEQASTITFEHPKGKELDAKITRLYERGTLSVTNFADSDDQEFLGKIRGKIESTLQRGWNDRRDLEEEWEVFKALYDLVNLDTSIRSNANVHVPEVAKAVNVRVRELMIAIFSRDTWASAIGMNEATIKKQRKVTEFMLDQLRNEKFPVKFKQWLKTLVMYGTSAALQNWGYLPKRVNAATVNVQDIGEGQVRVTIEKPSDAERNVRISQPLFEPLRLFDFVGDPFCFDVQRGTFAGHRIMMTRAQIKAMEEGGLWKGTDQLETKDVLTQQRHANVVSRHLTDDLRQHSTSRATEIFEIWEVWAPIELPSGEEREGVITIERNSMTVLRVSENPFWHGLRPYLVAQYDQDEDGGLYGRGIIELIASLQIELDDTRNLALIAKDLIVNPMWTAPLEADLVPERLVASPGRVLPPGLTPVQVDSSGQFSAFRHEVAIKGDIREVINTPSALSGAAQAGDETATENVNRIQESKNDTAEVARDISDLALLPMLNMRHGLNAQFMREERVFKKLGAPARPNEPLFAVIDPTDLVGDFFYEWRGLRDFAVKGKRIGIMRQLMDTFARFPGLNIDVNSIARTLAMEVFDDQDARKFFPDLHEDSQLTPTEEHDLLLTGMELVVHPLDNHQFHVESHRGFLDSRPRGLDIKGQLNLEAHILNHSAEIQKFLNELANAQQASRLQMAQQAGMMPPTGQPRIPGQNGGAQRGSRPREVVPNQQATQAPEAQQAQIGGVGAQGF